MFKRREKRSWFESIRAALWPKGGWGRAYNYVKLRLRRLPDSPAKISRGIWAGVFTTFTPFYGLHFVVAALLALVMRGNVLAAVLSTFFGNPLTYVPIAFVSMQTGYFLLGIRPATHLGSVGRRFGGAWRDLKHNFWAIFNEDRADWHGLARFYDEVFFPYMVGGIIPGLIVASVVYVFALPVIEAYQNRRRKILKEKLASLKRPNEPD